MGKGARQRAQRAISTQEALNLMQIPEVRKAVTKQINEQLAPAADRFFMDETAVILYTLRETFGFGEKRLKQFYDSYIPHCEALKKHYELSDEDMPFACRLKLKEDGIDIEKW